MHGVGGQPEGERSEPEWLVSPRASEARHRSDPERGASEDPAGSPGAMGKRGAWWSIRGAAPQRPGAITKASPSPARGTERRGTKAHSPQAVGSKRGAPSNRGRQAPEQEGAAQAHRDHATAWTRKPKRSKRAKRAWKRHAHSRRAPRDPTGVPGLFHFPTPTLLSLAPWFLYE